MNRNISDLQFRLVSNLKNKPNAQGTLFSINPSQRTPASRQPRGYSPERYKEVTEATDIRHRNTRGTGYGQHPHGGMNLRVYHGHAGTLANAAASLARSTVPMSDITRPHRDQPASGDNPDLHIGIWDAGSMAGNLGHYSKPGTTAIPHQGRIAITSGGRHPDTTVLHEIGHHVDRDQPYNSAAKMGRAEGFADEYAARHARSPGYKKRRVEIPSHPESWHDTLKGGAYEHSVFNNEYRGQRTSLQPLQFDSNNNWVPEGHEKTYPKGHIKGQLALINKVFGEPASYGRPATPTTWRYSDDLSGEKR